MRALKQDHEQRARALTDGAVADTRVHFVPRPAPQQDAAAAVKPAQQAHAGVIAPLSELAQAVCGASQAAAPALPVRPPTLVMFVPDCLEVSAQLYKLCSLML